MSLLLLPTLVLLAAGTAVLLATRAWKRLGSRPGGSRGSRAAPEAPGSPPAEESPRRGPAAPGSPPFIPCGCGPGCGPCVTAARELQDLVTPLWPGVSFPRDSEMWRLSWEDLEQLLERGHLPCCASSGSSAGLPIRRRASAAGKDSVLRRTRRWLRSSLLPRMRPPRKGSSVPSQTLCDPCCAPTPARPARVSWSRRCPIHGSQDPGAEPAGQTLRSLLDKRLRRQRLLLPCPGCPSDSALKDKEELQSRDNSSESLHPCQSLQEIRWAPGGGAHTESPPCRLGAVAVCATRRTPAAGKSPESQAGTQAVPAQHSRQRAAQQGPSPSRRCPLHGGGDAAGVAREKSLRAALAGRLQREGKRPLPQEAPGRGRARLGARLEAAAATLRGVLGAG